MIITQICHKSKLSICYIYEKRYNIIDYEENGVISMNETEKKRKFIIDFVYLLIILGLSYLAIKRLFPIISPLLVAWLIASILQRPTNYISKKLKINHKITAVALLLITYALVVLIVLLLATSLFGAIRDLFMTFPTIYTKELEPYLIQLFNDIQANLIASYPDIITNVSEFSSSILSWLANSVTNVSMWVVTIITNFAKTLPNTFIRVLVSIVASVFMVLDYQNIVNFVAKQFSKKTRDIAIDVKNYIINILWSYVKSYSLIMLITFCELAIGLSILQVKNGVLIALIIAFFDILPILGTGTILIPWVIVSLIQQKFAFAIQMAIIYIIVTVIRNIIEPKIVGKQVGLPPLIILISIFVGAQLFGIIGLFGFPILLSLLNYLNKKKTIKLFNN